MDQQVLKDNLDFYEKIIKVTTINDKISNELNASLGLLYSLTTFNSWLAKFNPEDETVVFSFKTYEFDADDCFNPILKLVYLRYLIENLGKENKGLRIIQNFSEYTNSSIDDLNDNLCDYIRFRKEYANDSDENIKFLQKYVWNLQERLNSIQKLLNELE